MCRRFASATRMAERSYRTPDHTHHPHPTSHLPYLFTTPLFSILHERQHPLHSLPSLLGHFAPTSDLVVAHDLRDIREPCRRRKQGEETREEPEGGGQGSFGVVEPQPVGPVGGERVGREER
jgi:hypothetical protein